jgi:glycosidase
MMAMRLNDILARNNNVVNDMMLNLLDSHDTSRFFTEVSEDKDTFMNGLCLLYLFPGAPCILYGTELMTPGGGDPDCRRCMDWEKAITAKQSEVFALIKKLAGLREKYVLLTKDARIYSENGLLILEYKKARTNIALIVNNTPKKKKCTYGDVEAHGRKLLLNTKQMI